MSQIYIFLFCLKLWVALWCVSTGLPLEWEHTYLIILSKQMKILRMMHIPQTKRDSTLDEHWGVKEIYDWPKSLPFIVIGLDPWIKNRVNYLSCIEGNGGFERHKMSRYLLIYYKISFHKTHIQEYYK